MTNYVVYLGLRNFLKPWLSFGGIISLGYVCAEDSTYALSPSFLCFNSLCG